MQCGLIVENLLRRQMLPLRGANVRQRSLVKIASRYSPTIMDKKLKRGGGNQVDSKWYILLIHTTEQGVQIKY